MSKKNFHVSLVVVLLEDMKQEGVRQHHHGRLGRDQRLLGFADLNG
jgi:hypothetical protein